MSSSAHSHCHTDHDIDISVQFGNLQHILVVGKVRRFLGDHGSVARLCDLWRAGRASISMRNKVPCMAICDTEVQCAGRHFVVL
jgi:hypothetical protein